MLKKILAVTLLLLLAGAAFIWLGNGVDRAAPGRPVATPDVERGAASQDDTGVSLAPGQTTSAPQGTQSIPVEHAQPPAPVVVEPLDLTIPADLVGQAEGVATPGDGRLPGLFGDKSPKRRLLSGKLLLEEDGPVSAEMLKGAEIAVDIPLD